MAVSLFSSSSARGNLRDGPFVIKGKKSIGREDLLLIYFDCFFSNFKLFFYIFLFLFQNGGRRLPLIWVFLGHLFSFIFPVE